MSILITAVVPGSDRIGGGVAAIILGSGFVATPGVTFGGTAATSVVFVSATRLTCIVPAHAAGDVNVVVTNPDTTTSTLTNGFTYYTPVSRETELIIDFGGVTPAVRHDTPAVAVTQSATQGQSTFAVDDQGPVLFTPVKLGLGSLADADLLFRGKVQVSAQSHEDTLDNPIWNVTAVDLRAEFNRNLVYGSYVAEDADLALLDVLAKSCPDFTGAHIVSGLDPITITFDGVVPEDAANQIATMIGGYFYWDKSYDVHLFITETPDLTPDPIDYTNTTLLNAPAFTFTKDGTQFRNQVIGIGASVQAFADTPVGSTALPVVSNIFPSAGTVYVANGAQRITFTDLAATFIPPLINQVTRTTPSAINWERVVWAPALNLFVAVAANSSASAVMTSPDGVTWTTRSPATNDPWSGLTWSPELSLFVAVSTNGTIMTSPDGVAWTGRTSPEANQWTGVCWSPTLSLFVMVGNTGTHRVQTSPDGVAWTSRTAAAANAYTDVIWASGLSLFVACDASSSTTAIMTSPDGLTWTLRTTPASLLLGLAYSPILNLLVAVGGFTTPIGYVLTSPDGVTWTSRTPANNNNWRRVLWIAELGVFIACSSDGAAVTGQRVMSSLDGINWVSYSTPTAGDWWSIAWSPTLNMLVFVGVTGGAAIMTSTVTWYYVLNGVPASGVGSVTSPISQGDSVSLYSERNDTASQATVAAIEGRKSTGIYTFKITDTTFVTQASLDARCDADLFQNSDADGVLKVDYTTLDPKSGFGRPLHVDRSLYADTALVYEPVGYWRLGEATGASAADISGEEHDGTYTGGFTMGVTGPLADGSKAVLFNGTTGYVVLGDILDPPAGSSISVTAWIKTSSSASQTIACRWYPGWRMGINAGQLDWGIWQPGSANDAVHGSSLADGNWHFLVCTFDASTRIARWYIDGVLVATENWSSSIFEAGNASTMYIGCLDPATQLLDGAVQDVTEYFGVLTDAQIATLYGRRTALGMRGDFIIQTVNISNIDEDMNDLAPRYACMALSQRLTLTTADLLRHGIK